VQNFSRAATPRATLSRYRHRLDSRRTNKNNTISLHRAPMEATPCLTRAYLRRSSVSTINATARNKNVRFRPLPWELPAKPSRVMTHTNNTCNCTLEPPWTHRFCTAVPRAAPWFNPCYSCTSNEAKSPENETITSE